ncbi:hypothetical protein H8A95_37310 [Bradyrhizobium sp. Pear76]|uniref:hypothetical protein n=1 Tax=Bradyrhizobium oropedii TaxID=1571201 RepID=UPI001E3F0C24|nr:hypothetical protein [Bradyrhizobium oropedii]MCC8967819.1 hypothetical protein [Bradyrhizobium oropedii]
MFEMQGIRMMHCTIWTEGVREIISAEDSSIKFIVSDHPITIYNYASPPEARICRYPNDPTIALKASQTIFPLNCNFCLILTNLEYAKDASTSIFRWNEITAHRQRQAARSSAPLYALAQRIESETFAFPKGIPDIETFASEATFAAYHKLMADIFRYLCRLGDHRPKPNLEAHLAAHFAKVHSTTQTAMRKSGADTRPAQISCMFPLGGIQDNNVNRLLLMSSSERHLPNVPMAFFING